MYHKIMIWANVAKFGQNFIAPPKFFGLVELCRQQQIRVRGDLNCLNLLESLTVCDRGGILSPYLFAVYIDQLSKDLNRVPVGCYIGNTLVNHIQRWAERNLKRKAQFPQLAQLRKLRCAFILF